MLMGPRKMEKRNKTRATDAHVALNYDGKTTWAADPHVVALEENAPRPGLVDSRLPHFGGGLSPELGRNRART